MTDQEEKTEAEKNTAYSAQIYVGKLELSENESKKLGMTVEEYRGRVEELSKKAVPVYGIIPSSNIPELLRSKELDNIKQIKDILHVVLDDVLENVFGSDDPAGFRAAQIQDLINIYVDNRIWFHSLNMQYYARHSSPIIEAAEKCFLDAHEAVREAIEKKPVDAKEKELYLYEYAQLWCQVKTNSACDYNGEVLYFNIEKLPNRCRQLYKKYPGFTNALILQGLSYEPSSSSANEAVGVFKEALDAMGEECFASAVYYWIGKRYEPFRNQREETDKQYAMAYHCKVKFRNIFKLAIAARDQGNTDQALKLFEEIPKKLSIKKDMNALDPLELEYLFKVYFLQMHICYKAENYKQAIEYGKKCESAWEGIDGCKYFDDFYGKETADEYRVALKKRLSIGKAYYILADSYMKILNDAGAEKYRTKYYKMKSVECRTFDSSIS